VEAAWAAGLLPDGREEVGRITLLLLSGLLLVHVSLKTRLGTLLPGRKPRLVKWTNGRLSVGVKGIDLQHRQLIVALNMLYQSVLLGDGPRQLRDTLGFLREYTVFHFSSEERFFGRHGCPKTGQHVGQHQWFIDRGRRSRIDQATMAWALG
jgi:hemerythrin-like metal-binding protein